MHANNMSLRRAEQNLCMHGNLSRIHSLEEYFHAKAALGTDRASVHVWAARLLNIDHRIRCACEAEHVRVPMLQVDYAAAGIFINITTDSDEGHSAPWWQLEGARMAPGLEPLTPVCPCPMLPHTQAIILSPRSAHTCVPLFGTFTGLVK